MQINSERLMERFNSISVIGKTMKGGLNRLALSNEDKQARDLFVKWSEEIGLTVRVDDFGNIFAKKEGKNAELLPVVTGSHLDSVSRGGKFDGTLGVLTGLEIVNSLIDYGIEHNHPIELAIFTNEEGARFETPMLGSGGMTKVFKKEFVYQMKDNRNLKFKDELVRIGYLGDERNRLNRFKSFTELHIEQGPQLYEQDISIGVVSGIQGLSLHQVTFTGQSDHAGPTPMNKRKDALMSAVKSMQRIYDWVLNLKDETTVTFGKCEVKPNTINVIPGKATFSIDIRHPNRKELLFRIKKIKDIILNIATFEDCKAVIEDISFMGPVMFSERLNSCLIEISEAENLSYKVMMSGAGHDSMYLNKLGDTTMIFIPSVDGKSHCEEEESTWEDINKGANLLLKLIKSEAK